MAYWNYSKIERRVNEINSLSESEKQDFIERLNARKDHLVRAQQSPGSELETFTLHVRIWTERGYTYESAQESYSIIKLKVEQLNNLSEAQKSDLINLIISKNYDELARIENALSCVDKCIRAGNTYDNCKQYADSSPCPF